MKSMLFLIIVVFLCSLSAYANTEICYQETANATSSCLNIITYDNGSYFFNVETAGWNPSQRHLMYDGDYGTGATSNPSDYGDGSLEVMYAIPNITGEQEFLNAIIQVKFTDGSVNATYNYSLVGGIGEGCINGYQDGYIRMKYDMISGNTNQSGDYIRIRCFHSPTSQTELDVGQGYTKLNTLFFEDGVYWIFNVTGIINGTEENPYIIDGCDDLYNITDAYAYYSLVTDLDCSAYMNYKQPSVLGDFYGVFMGNNHTIRNLNFTTTGTAGAGFAKTLRGGVITDLHLDRMRVTATIFGDTNQGECGGVAGILKSGRVERVSVTSSYFECGFDVGGIGGQISRDGRLEVHDVFGWNNTIYATILAGCESQTMASGFIGRSLTTPAMNISDAYSSADIQLRPSCTTGKGFMGGSIIPNSSGLYYDLSMTSYPDNNALGIYSYNFTDSAFFGFENYSLDLWRIEDCYYPFFTWMSRVYYPPSVGIHGISFSDGEYHDFISDGYDVEYHHGNWTFNISVYDCEETDEHILVRNDTGTIFQGIDYLNVTLSYDKFLEFYQNYSISVNSTDSYGNSTEIEVNFTIDDSIFPQCSGLEDDLILNGTAYFWDVLCTDDSLYIMNISCTNGKGIYYEMLSRQMVYQDYAVITGQVSCGYEVCDGHTKNIIENIDMRKNKPDTLTFDGYDLTSKEKTKNIDYTKKVDRYSFSFEYEEEKAEIEIEVPFGCEWTGDKRYKGWFICPEGRYWIDFEGDHEVEVRGHKVIVKSDKPKKLFEFNSIGKLNCIYGNQTIMTYTETEGTGLETNVCPDSLISMMGLFIITMIGLALIFAGMGYNSAGIGIFGSLMMILVAWIIYGCYPMAGAVLSTGSIFMVIWFAIKKNPV